jgi:predicted transcriptional regulator
MFGLGKKQSPFGKWLAKRGISQQWVVKKSGVGRNTVSDLAAGKRDPNARTMKKILKALREIDPNIKQDDFWPM